MTIQELIDKLEEAKKEMNSEATVTLHEIFGGLCINDGSPLDIFIEIK